MEELKPCKCGNRNPTKHSDFYPFEEPYPMNWVMCHKCNSETKVYLTMEEAISAWNKRS